MADTTPWSRWNRSFRPTTISVERRQLLAASRGGVEGGDVDLQTHAAVAPEELAPAFAICLVVSSEASGVSPDIIAMADVAVSIPMLGTANSINVATAAAITLYKLSSLRR